MQDQASEKPQTQQIISVLFSHLYIYLSVQNYVYLSEYSKLQALNFATHAKEALKKVSTTMEVSRKLPKWETPK